MAAVNLRYDTWNFISVEYYLVVLSTTVIIMKSVINHCHSLFSLVIIH